MADNFFGITDTGKLRDNNEDALITQKLSNGWVLACVIDGVGGYEGGEVAAEIARETILKKLQHPFTDATQTLKEAVSQAAQNIYSEKQKEGASNNMACVLTVTLANVDDNQFYYAHVGDTRMYLLRDGSLVKVTKDHSFVGFLEDSGRLSEREAMLHPKRNEITKALGFDGNIIEDDDYIETGSSPFLPGDVLLLCSDGLTDMVNNEDMKAVLLSDKNLSEKGTDLIHAANKAGGKDNITVVIVSNNKKPQKQKATKPIAAKKKFENKEDEDVVIAEVEQNSVERTVITKKKSNAFVWLLIILCLALASLCYWLWTKNKEPEKLPETYAVKQPNAAEKILRDSIAIAPGTLTVYDSVFSKTITVSDTIFIRQDSLRINGTGLLLQRDSLYNGPAFFVTANCRFFSLENIIFKDFATAVVMQTKGLSLKNVVFQNAVVPVQRNLLLPLNDTITGIISDNFLTKKDSIRK